MKLIHLKLTLFTWYVSLTLLPLSFLLFFFYQDKFFLQSLGVYLFISLFIAYFLSKKIISLVEKDKQEHPMLDLKKNPWDKNELSYRLGNNISTMTTTIDLFISDTQRLLQLMQIAIEENNFSKIAIYSHSIKGSAANMSALNISQIAQNLEYEAKKTKDIQNIIYLFVLLEKEWKTILKLLQSFMQENTNTKEISLSSHEIFQTLEALKEKLQNNEFIDTNNIDLFHLELSQRLNTLLKQLKYEIDNFEFDKTFLTITDIEKELQTIGFK